MLRRRHALGLTASAAFAPLPMLASADTGRLGAVVFACPGISQQAKLRRGVIVRTVVPDALAHHLGPKPRTRVHPQKRSPALGQAPQTQRALFRVARNSSAAMRPVCPHR